MDKFKRKKKYIFDLDTALSDFIFAQNYNNTINNWIDYCCGKEVQVIDEYIGKIYSPEKEYTIVPWWCKEI